MNTGWRRALSALLAAWIAVHAHDARACGYTAGADRADDFESALRALLTAPELPLIDGEWRRHYVVLAWARARGKQFSEAEIDALVNEPDLDQHCSGCQVSSAIVAWIEAREGASSRVGLALPIARIDAHRRSRYAYRLVCGSDAFATAAETLRAREATYSASELRAWIEAQDAVFASCSDAAAALPAEAPADARSLVRDDRAYQRAAALFFSGHAAEAARSFDAIASTGSPWADIARYRAAFALSLDGDALRDPGDLEARASAMRDGKALRALGQLRDRVALYQEPASRVLSVLGERLITQDLGADVVRVVRDIVVWSERDESACETEIGVVLRECVDAPASPLANAFRGLRAGREVDAPRCADGDCLALNVLFHRIRGVIEHHREGEARRLLAAHASEIEGSTRATVNAFRALALPVARTQDETIRAALRYRDGEEVALFYDGRVALRAMSLRAWRALLDDERLPVEMRMTIASEGVVRSAIERRHSDARAFITFLSASAPSPELTDLLARTGEDFERALLLFVVGHDVAELSVGEPFDAHYGSLPEQGCTLGECSARSPAESVVGLLSLESAPQPSHRMRALGARVLALAAHDPGDARVPELLHRYVRLTRRASVHHMTDASTGRYSRGAFELLHGRFAASTWATATPYWYQ